MIVLDTNIVSETVKPRPDPVMMSWLKTQDPNQLFVSGPVLMEQSYGAERYNHRTGSERYLRHLSHVIGRFDGRILEFTGNAPVLAGKLRADRERMGRSINVQDAMIAAICLTHGAMLATRNMRDFEGIGLKLVNPFETVV